MTEHNLSFFVQQNITALAHRLLKQLAAVMKSALLYPPQHPYFVRALQGVFETLQNLFKYQKEATFVLKENELYFGDIPFTEDNLTVRQFISELDRRKIQSVSFLQEIRREEIVAFLQALIESIGNQPACRDILFLLTEKNITHVKINEAVFLQSLSWQGVMYGKDDDAPHKAQMAQIFFETISVLKNIMQEVEHERDFEVEQVRTVMHRIIETVLQDEVYLLGLTAVKNYDEYAYCHSVNVAILALYLGKLVGLSQEQLGMLGEAAMLHDVGKVKITREIINKPGKLTPAEWQVMERHPVEGAEILSRIAGVNRLSVIVAFQHHLHYDFSGYPHLWQKQELHLLSRLIAICDVYDAATALRTYHAPVLPTKALIFMLGKRGTFFDPLLTKVFVHQMGLYPVGALVRLSTGEIGLVYERNPQAVLRPKVLVIEPGGTVTVKHSLNLEDRHGDGRNCSIVEALDPEALHVDVSALLRGVYLPG